MKIHERKATLSVSDVLKDVEFSVDSSVTKVIAGESVVVNTPLLQVFAHKGVKCIDCGVEGLFFSLEKNRTTIHGGYLLHLYGYDPSGQEILIIKTKIDKRGNNDFDNLAPICLHCHEQRMAQVSIFKEGSTGSVRTRKVKRAIADIVYQDNISKEAQLDAIMDLVVGYVAYLRKREQSLLTTLTRQRAAGLSRIAGALLDTIHAHGDIKPDNISSAAKRIYGQLAKGKDE